MKKIYSNLIVFIALAIMSIGLGSCLDESAKRLPCEPFSTQEQLRWFAGEVGDTLSFRNQNNAGKAFEIRDKYVIHTTSYVALPGCNCHDIWGILLVDGTDSIGVFGQHIYNQTEGYILNNLNIRVDGTLTSFNSLHMTTLATYRLEGRDFQNVVRFQHSHTDSLQFRAIFIARDIGIVRMERVNGEIWTNTQLGRTFAFDFDSFQYSERTCE